MGEHVARRCQPETAGPSRAGDTLVPQPLYDTPPVPSSGTCFCPPDSSVHARLLETDPAVRARGQGWASQMGWGGECEPQDHQSPGGWARGRHPEPQIWNFLSHSAGRRGGEEVRPGARRGGASSGGAPPWETEGVGTQRACAATLWDRKAMAVAQLRAER